MTQPEDITTAGPLALSLHDGLGPTPPADPRRALQYGAIRYVAGYPDSYLQEYARAYAAEQVAAERERCAKLCEERFSHGALDIADAIRKGPNVADKLAPAAEPAKEADIGNAGGAKDWTRW